MRVPPVTLSRESVSEGECAPWCRSLQLYTPALSSLSFAFEFEYLTIGFWRWSQDYCQLTNGKMQTLRTDSKKRPNARATILNFEGVATPPRHCRSPLKRGLVFSLGFDHKTSARPASRAVGRSADCASQYFFIFCLPLFFTLNNSRFFLAYFCTSAAHCAHAVQLQRVPPLLLLPLQLLRAALSNREKCLFYLFLFVFYHFLPNCAAKCCLMG